ncbi:MAG: response regulator transcription factor [Lachnospiraceae bacterium]
MYRILIADDEQIERKVLYKTLEKHFSDFCEIYQAENGREALRIYEEKQIQIAILDIEMPGMDGIQTAEAIRKRDLDCCLIFLTAYDEFSYARKAISVRALDYLLKPYQEDELLSVLEMAIYQIDKVRSEAGKAKPNEIFGVRENVVFPSEDELMDNGQVRLGKVKESIKNYIKNRYMEDISLQQVAKEMNYSEPYFCKLFKQCFSRNFTAYLTEFRMEEAKRLLLEPTANVKNIGESVGYLDSSYFAKVFRRYTGSSPTEYRMELYQRNE